MLKKPDEIAGILTRRFDLEFLSWLEGEGGWPVRIPLGVPGDRDWDNCAEGVQNWILEWKGKCGDAAIEWDSRRFHHRGELRYPAAIRFGEPGEIARWIGKKAKWDQATRLRTRLLSRWPEAQAAIRRHLEEMTGWDEADIDRFEAVITWLVEHPNPGIFRRAVPVRGIHSKWIEARASAIHDFFAHEAELGESTDPISALGLLSPPRLVRWRMLSSDLRDAIGGIDSLATSIDDLARLKIRPARLIVIENLETMLALPDLDGTMAILGMGYAVDSLGSIPWIQDLPAAYWGDLDTHGFGILDRARSHAAQLESILMDRATLIEHKDLWSFEKDQHRAISFERLTGIESALYSELKNNSFGIGVRLEQERIPMEWANRQLESWAARI